jgi:hypothetical protein
VRVTQALEKRVRRDLAAIGSKLRKSRDGRFWIGGEEIDLAAYAREHGLDRAYGRRRLRAKTQLAPPASEMARASYCVVQWTLTTDCPPRRSEAAFTASLKDARRMIPAGLAWRPTKPDGSGLVETWRWQPDLLNG